MTPNAEPEPLTLPEVVVLVCRALELKPELVTRLVITPGRVEIEAIQYLPRVDR